MAGIADVQPKSIGQVSLPVMAPVVQPGPAGSGVSETLPQAFDAYSNMFNRIKDKPLIDLQRENAMQQAQIAQQNAPVIGQAQRAAAALSVAQSQNAAGSLGAEDLVNLYRAVHGVDKLDDYGNTDYAFMKRGGVDIHNALWQQTKGLDGMTPIMQNYPGPNGQPMVRVVNKFGDLFYKPDGTENKVIQQYRDLYRNAGLTLHTNPDKSGNTPSNTAPDPDDEEASAPPPQEPLSPTLADTLVTPKTAPISPGIPLAPSDVVSSAPLPATPPSTTPVFPQDLVSGVRPNLGLPPATQQPAAGFSPSDALASYAAWNARQAASAPQPTAAPTTTITHDASNKPVVSITPPPVNPASSPSAIVQPRTVAGPGQQAQMGQADYMGGFPTGLAPGQLNTPEAIQKQKSANPGWQIWQDSTGEANEIRSLAADPRATKPQGDMNAFDLRLKAAMNAMLNPQSKAGRAGAMMAEMELKQPYFEKYVSNVGQFLAGTGSLTPGSRQALLHAAQAVVSTREQTARGAVTSAIAQYQRSNLWPSKMDDFTPEELALAQGGSTTGGQRTPAGPPRTLSSGRQIQLWQ